jgi:exodeoxyribonuclease VII large subunit
MEENRSVRLDVSDFIALTNQTLEFAYPTVEVEGEVAGFKVSQGKYVFFDLKDKGGSVGCFMTVWQLRAPVEDGMKVVVTATPKLTQWGKFSLTVRAVTPSGEGSLKKSFELLRSKLEKEGLFAAERKRPLPPLPQHVAVISSTQAAGYADFIKIVNDRWGGITVDVAHVHVQGGEAPEQMLRALRYFNSREELPEVIVLVRGGGSSDDLSAFNDEALVREIAASRVPTLVGVGHETDMSLADMAADVRAATPSNAAQLLVPDRREVIHRVRTRLRGLLPLVEHAADRRHEEVRLHLEHAVERIERRRAAYEDRLQSARHVLAELNPEKVLERGYALVRGNVARGSVVTIEKSDSLITAEVTDVRKK